MKHCTYFQNLAYNANAPRIEAMRKTKEYKDFITELETIFEDRAKNGNYHAVVVYTELPTWENLKRKLNRTPFFNYDFRDAFREDMRNAGFEFDTEGYPTVTFCWGDKFWLTFPANWL